MVVVFFEDMNSFLERVTILETRLPSSKAYQNCLMDVFTSFLTLTGYAHKYIELGRFSKSPMKDPALLYIQPCCLAHIFYFAREMDNEFDWR